MTAPSPEVLLLDGLDVDDPLCGGLDPIENIDGDIATADALTGQSFNNPFDFEGFDGGADITANADALNKVSAPFVPDVAGADPMSCSPPFFDPMDRGSGDTPTMETPFWDNLLDVGPVGDVSSWPNTTPFQVGAMRSPLGGTPAISTNPVDQSCTTTAPLSIDPVQRAISNGGTANDAVKPQCPQCNKYPEGFHSKFELKRHHENHHAPRRVVWVCCDDAREGLRPLNCQRCLDHKTYKTASNAADHLWRKHIRDRGLNDHGDGDVLMAGTAGTKRPKLQEMKDRGWLIREVVDDTGSVADTATTTVAATETGTGLPSLTTAATQQTRSDPITPPGNPANEADMAGVGVWMEGSYFSDFIEDDFSRPCA